MNIRPIVYLDTSFITEAYEAFTGKPVPVSVTKCREVTGGFSAAIFSAGASSQETKEFSISAHAMYDEMRSELGTFPSVDLAITGPEELPGIFWATGIFAVGSSEVSRKQEVIHRDEYFRLYPSTAKKKGVCMLTSDIYFSSGYDQVLAHIHGASRGFGIEVKALVKCLALQKSNFWPLCTPLVMEKTGNA
jgi:hypothetical protein